MFVRIQGAPRRKPGLGPRGCRGDHGPDAVAALEDWRPYLRATVAHAYSRLLRFALEGESSGEPAMVEVDRVLDQVSLRQYCV